LRGTFPDKVIHGGEVLKYEEQNGRKVIDFSASLNPVPPGVIWGIDPSSLSHYPDNTYTTLKDIIADTFHRDPEEITVGNGSIELIRVFCAVVLAKNDSYITDAPTFGEYALSASLSGARPAIVGEHAVVSFICNPNNPTGRLYGRKEVGRILKVNSSIGTMTFLDEAFIELADPSESLVGLRDRHLFVLRSLTKCFAVPGLRFGYGFGEPELIRRMEVARPPWSVNAYAEKFAIEAFRHYDQLEASRTYIKKECAWMSKKLTGLGLHPYPSSANFILIDLPVNAARITRALARRGFLVRDCTSFGLPASIRVAVRLHEDNAALVEEISDCLQ